MTENEDGIQYLYGIKLDGVFVIVQVIFVILELLNLIDWDYALILLPSVIFMIYVTIRDGKHWCIFATDTNEEDYYEEED